jgi:cardiolipin synthase (CMP-forming)
MIDAKQFADMLTFSRLLIGLAMLGLGIVEGQAALPLVCWLLMASWTSDVLDGGIARHSSRHDHTWVGDHDLEFDMAVAMGVFCFLATAGLIPGWLIIAYPLVWAFVFWRFGIFSSLGKLFQAPIYGYLIVLAVINSPITGGLMIAWIMAAVIVTWPRFPQEVIPSFLDGMGEVRQYLRKRSQ